MQEEIRQAKATKVEDTNKTRDFGTIKEIKKGLHFNEKMMNITKSARKETYMSGKSVFMEEMLSPINSALKKALKIKTNKVGQKDIQSIYTLDKLIDHPKLFAKYPFLKNQEVVFVNFHTRKKRGLTGKGSIFLNTQIKNKNLLYSTLVHEIQHSIQDGTGKTQYHGLGTITNKDILESEARERQNEYLESVGEERLPAYGEVESYKSPKEKVGSLPNEIIDWKDGIRGMRQGELDGGKLLVLGEPTGIVGKVVGKAKIWMKQRQLKNHMKQHNLNWDDIITLQSDIKNPIMVYEGGSKHKGLVIITNKSKGDKKISVVIGLDKNGNPKINEIRSIHPKEAQRHKQEMQDGKVLKEYFRDDKKVRTWLDEDSFKGSQSTTSRTGPTTKSRNISIISKKENKANESVESLCLTNGFVGFFIERIEEK